MNAARLNRCSIVALVAVLISGCGTEVPGPAEIERELTEPAVIQLGQASIALDSRQDDVDPDPFVVHITNGGGGQLSDLQASVQYGSVTGPQWLEVDVDTGTDPIELRVQVRLAGLPVGSHRARVRLTASAANVAAEVALSLEVQPPRHDFSFSIAPAVSDSVVLLGDTIRLANFEVVNDWPEARRVTLRAYQSSDDQLSVEDVLFLESTHEVGASSPARLAGVEVTATSGLPRSEFLIFVLDPDDEVMESNEDNNSVAVGYRLEEAPLEIGWALNVSVQGRGSVSRSPDQTRYSNGAEVELRATADPGWVFETWLSGGARVSSNPLTVRMNVSMNVTAVFREAVPQPDLTGRVGPTGRADLTWEFDWPCIRIGRDCLMSSSDRYELQMRDARGAFETVFESENTRTTPYTHSRRLGEGEWTFRVRAIGSAFTSPWSEELTLTYAAPVSNPPAAPTNVQATVTPDGGTFRYEVTWEDNATNESGYRLYSGYDPSSPGTRTDLEANVTSFSFSSSSISRTVYFRVDAWNDDGVGQSSIVSVDPPSTSGTVRFMNNTSYPVHSLVVNGTQLLPQDDDAYLPGQWYEIELETGVYTFEMVNGFWDGSFWNSLYTWSGSVLVPPGVDRDVVFPDPTASDLMTRFSSAHTWSGTYVDGTGNIRVVAITFRDNGQWNLSIDDQANSAGTYSIESRSPAAFNVGIRMTNNTVGTLWESLGFFSVAIEPGRIAQLFPDS